MAELLPCPNPWCGSTETELADWKDIDDSRWFQRGCKHCTCGAPPQRSAELADAAWNTRPAPSTRMADVTLGAEAALRSLANPCTWHVGQGRYTGDLVKDCIDCAEIEAQTQDEAARIAATVTLPDAKGEKPWLCEVTVTEREGCRRCKNNIEGRVICPSCGLGVEASFAPVPTPEPKGTQGTDGVREAAKAVSEWAGLHHECDHKRKSCEELGCPGQRFKTLQAALAHKEGE